MTTTPHQYPLPNKHHDVVDDINSLRTALGMIDADVQKLEQKIATKEEVVSDLEDRAIHCESAIANSEIQNIQASRYVVVNTDGNGFECLDGGGDAGGAVNQCSIKKSDQNFDTAWADILDVSKNGMVVQENSNVAKSNETHIFCDSAEINNEDQLPKVELTNFQENSDRVLENNEAVILRNSFEPIEESEQIATNQNFGLVKIGAGLSITNGVLSAPEYPTATGETAGIVKIGDGLAVDDGVISRDVINPASYENFGVVKIGKNLKINSLDELESDMSGSATIYDLGRIKVCDNGLVDIEEDILVYRLFVNSDIVVTLSPTFSATDDFSFVLEIVSDSTHIITFSNELNPQISPLPINLGITRFNFTKRIGVPVYDVTISRLDAPNPTLLTPRIESYISSEFCITSSGGSWTANNLLRTSYDGYCDITELNFKFETLVCVDYVNYISRSSSAAMGEFILKGSNDGKNWTTLIYKNGEVIYGKIYTELKGCFRYYNLKIGYTSDDNKPGGVTLWGTQIDNNESELTVLTPYMSSNSTAFATFTTSGEVVDGSVGNITDEVGNGNWLIITKTGDDWIKFEFPTAQIANLLELHYGPAGNIYAYKGERQSNWFKLFGSNDNSNWTLLLERQYQGGSLQKNNYVLFFSLNNETAYKYYKFVCVATNYSEAKWDIRGVRLYRRDIGRHNFYRGVPKLSSANQDGYEITASSQYDNSHAGYLALDDNTQTRWASVENEGNSWLQVKLPTAMAFNAVKIAPRGDYYLDQAPSAFQIQGSNDAENWDVLDSETNVSWTTLGELRLFQFENETEYLYYRLYITANQGSAYNGCSCFILGNVIYEFKRYLEKYDYVVPVMSSNSQDGYVASASTSYTAGGHYPYFAFDRQNGIANKWLTDNDDVNGSWLKIELPTAQVSSMFLMQTPDEYSEVSRVPTSFKIQGSNDDSSWTDLVNVSNIFWINNEIKTWTNSSSTAYKYYRVLISANGGSNMVAIGRFDLITNTIITEY